MRLFRIGLLLLFAQLASGNAFAQGAGCAGIANREARLDCYDRAGQGGAPRQAAPRQAPPAAPQGNCTAASPCVGPRGGVYYYTPSGNKRYARRR
jgi:hypothetical protein